MNEQLPAPPERSLAKTLGYWVFILLGIAYIFNPTAGIFELIPDNMPVIGNLDEAGATALVIASIQQLRK
jgi:uncharacterized membrane protein YkvA (DUF1232 family)